MLSSVRTAVLLSSGSLAAAALASEAAGLAFDARDMSASVKGHTTNFDGDANGLFTYFSPSTKYVRNAAGILVPGTTMRCDHDASGNKLGLLIEEQRTNLLTRSSEFGDAAYTKTRSSVTDNALAAPDGTTTADKLVEDNTAANSHTLARSVGNPLAAGTYTFSVFAKKGERKNLIVRLIEDPASAARAHRVNFNLNTGAIVANDDSNSPTSTNQTITDVGNGWYRLTVTQGNASGSRFDVQMFLWDDDTLPGNPTYSGNGASGIYLWGAQCELGAFPTSYIPTAGSQVTRAADNITLLATAFPLNSAEGTVFAEFIPARAIASGNPRVMRLAGAGNDYMEIAGFSSTPDKYSFIIRTAAGFQADLSSASANYNATYGSRFRLAGAYKANDSASSANGNTASTDTSVALPTVTGLALGSTSGGSHLNGHLARLKYLHRRAPDAELQALAA